jgi:hypothetical protein
MYKFCQAKHIPFQLVMRRNASGCGGLPGGPNM